MEKICVGKSAVLMEYHAWSNGYKVKFRAMVSICIKNVSQFSARHNDSFTFCDRVARSTNVCHYRLRISAERSWRDVDISSSGRLKRRLKIGLTIITDNI